MKKYLILVIFTFTMLGAFLRLYGLNNNPIGLNVDEVSIGYNAYSILKTGRDEYDKPYPLTFKSLGDFKPPVYIYLTVPSIALFGLNEFSVRFPSAILATLAIPFFYLFLLKFVKDKKYALVGTILLAISPWHLFFSRLASETSVATTLTLVGVFCLLKLFKGGWIWFVTAAIFLVLPMYTYHSERLFIPIFVLLFLLLNRKKLYHQKNKLIIFILLFFVLLIPLGLSLILGQDSTRLQMTLISNDINFTRYISLSSGTPLSGLYGMITNFFGGGGFLLFFHWIRKYLAYFQPSFLFYNGLDMTATGTYGLGVMYLFEIPFLVMGIYTLFTKEIENKQLIIVWLLLGILPASLTLSERQPFRSMVILPMLVLVSAIGAVELFKQVLKMTTFFKARIIFSLFSIFIIFNLIQAFLIFTIHFPNQRGEYFMEGNKEAVKYILENKDKYKEIVFDPNRGTDGPFVVTVPHLYILFYSKYEPLIYQHDTKREGGEAFGFDKYTIRQVNWIEDGDKADTLFIATPWHIPEKELKTGEILQKVYLSNGNLAYLIVSPKPN